MLTHTMEVRKGEVILFGCRRFIANFYEENPESVKLEILSAVKLLFPNHEIVDKDQRVLWANSWPFSSHKIMDTLFTLEPKKLSA